MVVPPENPSGNKLSRKSQRKAVQRALGKQKRRKKPSAKKPSAKQPKTQPKAAARRGGLPVNAPPGIKALEQVNLNAAGIDVGATVHFVAVPEGRDSETSVRWFGAFTADLEGLADWLEECGIDTVAMESTGVYWIPLYELLEGRGFTCLLVNPADLKKFRRKTDVVDCQWLQTLHTFGLLQGSFRPEEKILELRSYMRQRDTLTKSAGDYVRRMQKALEQMNLKLTHVIADITGVTGLRIIDAIVEGERDPQKLAELRDERCKNDEATIALALQGNWRDEHLFALEQSLAMWRFHQQKLDEVDARLERYLETFEDKSQGRELPKQQKKGPNAPRFDTVNVMYRLTGVELTSVDGIGGHAALQLVSEIGLDMSAWATEKHFVSWLCLCPELHLSGGQKKSKHSKTHASKSRAAATLRMCAQSLLRADCALGAFGRRLRAKKGAPQAVTAVARKLAIIVYNMLKHGRQYVDRGAAYYEAQYRQRVIKSLRRRASELGFDLMATATA